MSDGAKVGSRFTDGFVAIQAGENEHVEGSSVLECRVYGNRFEEIEKR
jgi:hypothetical protein